MGARWEGREWVDLRALVSQVMAALPNVPDVTKQWASEADLHPDLDGPPNSLAEALLYYQEHEIVVLFFLRM